MKKILLGFILLFSLQSVAAKQVEDAFINIPEHYFPLLTREMRLTLLARYSFANIDTIVNNFGGTTRILELDTANNYLKLALTERSTFEMKIWTTTNRTQIIGFSHTVCGPTCDSHVAFFNTNFERIDAEDGRFFPHIFVENFFDLEKIISEGLKIEDFLIMHDIFFATIKFQPSENDIILKSNIRDFLPQEIYAEIKPYLLGNKMRITWRNGFFEKGEVGWY